MLMFMAAVIAMLFLVCSRAAAREDELMGIRFEGEGRQKKRHGHQNTPHTD